MLKTETRQKVLFVTPGGEIDACNAERIRTTIDAAFEKSPCIHMVFDFAQVGFMDSSGIGMLIGRYKQTEKRGGALALVNMNDSMARLFTLSGLAKIIKQYPTVQDAFTALGGVQ